MTKTIFVNKKSRGRPKKKGGVYPVTAVRLAPELGAAVDKWAGSQSDAPTRSEAIRRLVEIGLKARRPSTKTKITIKSSRIKRAAELAAQAIEGMIDSNAPPEERDRLRLRLTKGPLEFREDRVDQPKQKK